MNSTEQSPAIPILYHFSSLFALLNGVCLLFAALLLGDHLENLYYRAFSIKFEVWLFFISVGASLLFTFIGMIKRKKKSDIKPFRTHVFWGFLRKTLLVSSVLLIFFSVLSCFYLDTYQQTATEELTNPYLIGISLKLYLMILLFSLAFSLLSLIFRAALLHPLVKLLIHYIGTVLTAAILELSLGDGLIDAKSKGTALLVLTGFYAVFSVGYLLTDLGKKKKTEEEAYTDLYHNK